MPLYHILVQDQSTHQYSKAGISRATSKKRALTEYFKTLYIDLIKDKNAYYIKRYAKIYPRIIGRTALSMSEKDLKMFLSYNHIVIPVKDFTPISLSLSEVNNLAKSIKKPKNQLKLSEDSQTKVREAFQQFRSDVKALKNEKPKVGRPRKKTSILAKSKVGRPRNKK